MSNKKQAKGSQRDDEDGGRPTVETRSKSNVASSSGKSPILKGSDTQGKFEKRADAYGNQIKKGSKKHKISFRENITDVKEVENWKEYNVDDGKTGGQRCCSIF